MLFNVIYILYIISCIYIYICISICINIHFVFNCFMWYICDSYCSFFISSFNCTNVCDPCGWSRLVGAAPCSTCCAVCGVCGVAVTLAVLLFEDWTHILRTEKSLNQLLEPIVGTQKPFVEPIVPCFFYGKVVEPIVFYVFLYFLDLVPSCADHVIAHDHEWPKLAPFT